MSSPRKPARLPARRSHSGGRRSGGQSHEQDFFSKLAIREIASLTTFARNDGENSMSLAFFLLSGVTAVYLAAFVFFLREFLSAETKSTSWASRLIELGFLIHTLLIFTQTFTLSDKLSSQFHLPVTTLGEASGFFAWSLAFVYLILLRQLKMETFGLILTPALVLFLIPAFFPFQVNPASLIHFHDTYFLLHILSAFFSYASFALSFIAALLYLALDRALKQKTSASFYHKLLSLDDLEHFIFRTIFLGFFLLGIAILSGAFWSKSAFGTFLLREPKSFASLLTWAVYLVIIYLHGILMRKGRRMVLMSLGAFVLVLFTFLGTSIFQTGLHVGIR